MKIISALVIMLLIAFLTNRVRAYKDRKAAIAADYDLFWKEMDEREFTVADRKEAEHTFKATDPHLNRHQRKVRAIEYLENVKAQARFERHGHLA